MAADVGHDAAVVAGSDRVRRRRPGFFSYLPGFVFILALYIIGKFVFTDPRATLINFAGYKLAWVEVPLLAAAIVAMAEQVKVAKPGVNNPTEVLLMGARNHSAFAVRSRCREGAEPWHF